MKLPITPDALKNAFPVPIGQLDLDVDAWRDLIASSTACFTPEVDNPTTFQLTSPAAQPAKFTLASDIEVSLGGTISADLSLDPVWEEGEESKEFETFKKDDWFKSALLGADNFYLGAQLVVRANVRAGAGVPIGSVAKGSLGIEAGAEVELQRWKAYARTTPARDVLIDFFSTFRSPLYLPSAGPVIGPGELIHFAYEGRLKFSAGVSAGYELSGFDGLRIADFKPILHHKIAAQATFDVGVTMGGAFRYTLASADAAGTAPSSRVRLRVAREKHLGHTTSLGVEIAGQLNLSGVPEDPAALLQSLLGVDVSGALEWLETIAGIKDFATAKAELKKKFGAYAAAQLEQLAAPVWNAIFDSQGYAAIQASAETLLKKSDQLRDQALGLLDRFKGQTAEATRVLDLVADLTPDKLRDLSDTAAWDFVLDHFGDQLIDAVRSVETFETVTAQAARLKTWLGEESGQRLASLWREMAERANLEKVAAILRTAADPAAARLALNTEVEGKLVTLAENVFDFTLGQLVNNAQGQAILGRIQALTGKLIAARDRLASVLRAAREQKFGATLGVEFGASSDNSALFDLEIDLSATRGPEILAAAFAGDFHPALAAAETGGSVRVLGGRLRRVQNTSRGLDVAAFGWSQAGLSNLSQLTDAVIRHTDDGLVYLVSTTTALETTDRTKFRHEIEEVKTRFILRTLGDADADQTDDIRRLRPLLHAMSVGYTVCTSDTATDWAEMTDYLRFAEQLSLLPGSRLEFEAQLRRRFPAGLGKVELAYAIKYPEAAFLEVLRASEPRTLRKSASQALRRYFVARYQTKKASAKNRELVDLYVRSADVVKVPALSGVRNHGQPDKVRVRFFDGTHSPAIAEGATHLRNWWKHEQSFLNALEALAAATRTGGVETGRLEKITEYFVSIPEGKLLRNSELWEDNMFFLVVDALITEADVRTRAALLTLRVQPPGAAEPATILLASASAA